MGSATATPDPELAGVLLDLAVRSNDAFVVTNAAGHLLWANDGFSTLCGYTLDEVRGQRPGTMLQGPLTDRSQVAELSAALHGRRTCTVELVNYHKDTSPYWVSLQVVPLPVVADLDLDPASSEAAFAAVERKIERPIPATPGCHNGLVPICSSCSSVRRHDGIWQPLQEWLANSNALQISHGVCPNCIHHWQ